MIPIRVKLENFLCHKDLDISFEGGALWLLHGGNGTGKSTIFDGITFSLFGGHRAGEIDADELIRKGCDKARVEFEFLLQGQRYRAQRTVQRRKGSPLCTTLLLRQRDPVEEEIPGEDSTDDWEPVPDTGQVRGFERWITAQTGLRYKTFVSSVVLQQDQAGRLLDARAKERFDLVSSLVDLERYQHLWEVVDRKRSRAAIRMQALREQVQAIPGWAPEVLDAEAAELLVAREAEAQAERLVEERHHLLRLAEDWQRKEEERQRRETELQRVHTVLAEEARIVREHQRLIELEQILPSMDQGIKARDELRVQSVVRADQEEQMAQVEADLSAVQEQVARREAELREARGREAGLMRAQEDAQRSLQRLAEPLAQIRVHRAQRAQVEELERRLAALPAGILAVLEREQAEEAALLVLERAWPQLRSLTRSRDEIGAAQQRAAAATARQERARAQVVEREALLSALTGARDAALLRERQAGQEDTAAAILLQRAQHSLSELEELHGKPSCDRCGQPLCAELLAAEQTRRQEGAAQATLRAASARHSHDAAAAVVREQEQRLAAVTRERDRALDAAREEEAMRRAAQTAAEGAAERVSQAVAELPLEYARREQEFQTAADLAALQQHLAGLPGLRDRVRETRRVVERELRPLTIALDSARQTLAAQEAQLPSDHDELVASEGRLQEHQRAVAQEVESCRSGCALIAEQLRGAEQQRQSVSRRQAALLSARAERELRERGAQATLDALRALLPQAWQVALDTVGAEAVAAWRAEHGALLRAGARDGVDVLRRAQRDRDVLEATLAELVQAQGAMPEEVRGGLGRMATMVKEADEGLRWRRREASDRDAALALHRKQRDERLRIEDEVRKAEEAEAMHETLSRLLGRKGLQLHLLQRAERQIVEFANVHLERLSGGQLRLRLRSTASGGEEALDLEAYNRMSGEQPVGVAFLSGSQRFRVAVSLALAMGQYASRQQRPLESVILDEGFGCLDEEGRQVMLQELQRLSGLLQRVLIVSHQEEFAEVFPHVYRFALVNGETQVTRELR